MENNNFMEKINDSIIIKSAETDEELCGRGYVHCTAWKESYRGIVCDRYLDTMTTEATTARARNFPENTIVAKDKDKVIGFAVYSPSSLQYIVRREMKTCRTLEKLMRSMSFRSITAGK